MKCMALVRRYINGLEKSQIFTTRELLSYGTRGAVDQATYALVKKEEIVRLARGVFVRKKEREYEAIEVAKAKARWFGKKIGRHGKDIAKEWGLIREGNEEEKFAVSGRTTKFRYGEKTINLIGTAGRKMYLGEGEAGEVIRGMWYYGERSVEEGKIKVNMWRMRREEREKFNGGGAWMPAWLSDCLPKRWTKPSLSHTGVA
jgi:hypothetical protein